MKKLLEISLGVVTSIGGFLETGSLATAVQAGAAYRFRLIWAILLGTLCLAFLVEMAGRFSAISKHTIADAIRERFGINLFLIAFIAMLMVNWLVLAAEIGGVALALQFATGWSFELWALPAGFAVWLLLWKGTFGVIEKGVSFLGLITLCFVVAAVMVRPPWREAGWGALPSLPDHNPAQYWFMAVGILGASISPYLFLFYSSGAVEDKWDDSYIGVNRAIAGLGISFGGFVAVAALIVAVMVFSVSGITQIESYDQIAPILTPVFGHWGYVLFCASLGIACFGAALELALTQGYLVAQGFGWRWGEDLPPQDDPGLSLTYTIFIVLAAVPIAFGLDPLKLTIFSMALTALALPVGVVPFLFLMNDERYVGKYRNGPISNTAVILIIGLGFIVALVTLPLQIFGGT
jgi:Mn2+/Fe2+ NRAMP family transporter